MIEEAKEQEITIDGSEMAGAVAGARGSVRRSRSKDVSFRLTERDYDVLEFLLDQKFASLEQLYFRFFDVREKVTDPLPNNLFVTRQRLSKLRQVGLVSTTRVYSEAKSLYLLAPRGFQVFRDRKPESAYANAPRDIDFRSYEHDTRVNDCRIAIERTGKVMKWISERKIRMQGFESQFSRFELPNEIIPDGIFVSSKGERIAFEIETTPRKKSRYEEKKESFQSVMRSENPLIHRVIWSGSTDRILSDLKEVVDHAPRFVIEPYSYFLSKLWPKGVPEKIGNAHE